jgi:hypothetical protein
MEGIKLSRSSTNNGDILCVILDLIECRRSGKQPHPSLMTKQSATVYCYHCRASHPREDMRLVITKTGKRWRCKQSIDAAKLGRKHHESFGRQVTEANKAESSLAAKRLAKSSMVSMK